MSKEKLTRATATAEEKDALTIQGRKVAKLIRDRDKLQGKGLEVAVEKYRQKLLGKRKAAEETLAEEALKLQKMTVR